MDRVDMNAKKRFSLLRKLIMLMATYSFLFLIIGPKFTIWNIMDADANGERIHDRAFKFIKGSHKEGVVELCFDGRAHGKEGRISLRFPEDEIAKKKESALGKTKLWSKDWKLGCDELKNDNVKFDILSHSTNEKIYLYNANRKQLGDLDNFTYVLFHPKYKDPSDLDELNFSLFWRDEANKEYFYMFTLRGKTQVALNITAYDYLKAFLKDYLTWPYFWYVVLSGGASH